ncbi:PLD nuclease N-terminal domain-containing protein [Microbacterium arborescens]|uniref:PLD nuclease N-terminal domain-containing protein n=1 Tax=Microbacterium arborescens TaxID=33883 RepID=UPI000DF72FDC|nr:PLD nuclease N-terminal domain-containing protein [Microbacterium arborescens]
MARLLLIGVLLALAFWVYSIVDCALQDATRHRGVSKPVWILIVVLLPVLGGILWFVVGRARRTSAPVRRAPDDDPDFLGSLGSVRDQDERIRRLEEELAALDAEANDPRDIPPAASSSSDDDAEGPAGSRGPRA